MLQNSKGSKIIVVDGKSWIVGERKISMWSESKCNESKYNKTEFIESKDNIETKDDKTEVIESKADKTEIDKVDA